MRALHPVCVEVLRQLEMLEKGNAEYLKPFTEPEIRNTSGRLTGYIKPEFTLKKV